MIVVAGAGLAGLQTVVALRSQGYDGRLTLLGAEDEPPYDRPPLTKELLRGEVDDSTLDADWAELDVDLRLSTRATSVGDGVLATDRGDVAFDGLVLATGAEPVRLPGADTALTLRTRADAAAAATRAASGCPAGHRRCGVDRGGGRDGGRRCRGRGHRRGGARRAAGRRAAARRSVRARSRGGPVRTCGWDRGSMRSSPARCTWSAASGSRPTSYCSRWVPGRRSCPASH